jgi:hypothetical protein
MKLLPVLAAAVLLGGCVKKFLDEEGFERATVQDPNATAAVGSDAVPKLSVYPGDEHNVKRGLEGRQVHMFSPHRNQTTVVEGKTLRQGRIKVIATYVGPPPPPDDWKP